MPSTMRQCEACMGRYAAQYFRNSSTCRLCMLQSEVDLLHRKDEEASKKYEELARKYDVLQEFVTNNIGCVPESVRTYANVLSSDRPATNEAATNEATPAPTTQQEVPFTQVKNGARPVNKKQFLPITMHNRFKILAEEEEDDHETRLIGDSIVRGQLQEFCGRATATRKRLCMPGGRLDDITASCDEATRGSDDNTLFIIHAGTNDVQNTRSEELLEKYKRMIQQYKTKSNKIIVSGILPRTSAETGFFSKAFSTNSRLQSLCSQEGIEFANFWDDFYNKPYLFQRDGLHLNEIGSARLGRLLSNKVSLFRTKNDQQPRAAQST